MPDAVAFKFDAVQADLHRLRRWWVAASMKENAEMLRVIRY